MIETTIREYLASKTSVPVKLERTPNMAESCIVVEKTGGSYTEEIFTATVAIQSYGATFAEAGELNQSVVGWMLAIRDEEQNIFDVSLNSDYNFTDTATKRYRYQAVFVVTYHN